tara:strand:+ start:538 stop:639 length:102 start_codon:yes stop_codon:yes gene_type:complete
MVLITPGPLKEVVVEEQPERRYENTRDNNKATA